MKKLLPLPLFGALVLAGSFLGPEAKGATITAISANNTPTVVNSIPVADYGDSGYYIFGMNPVPLASNYYNVSSDAGVDGLPSWASVSFTDPGSGFVDIAATNRLEIGGNDYILARFGDGGTGKATTITLLAGAPSEFKLAILTNATNDTGWNFSVSTPSFGAPTSSVTMGNTDFRTNTNDFYSLNVTGAAPGDTFEIVGERYSGFTLSAVPEPTVTVLVTGVIGVVGLMRRRRGC